MAGRKNKHTVDYFPHYCDKNSKTMFILEKSFGLKGYAIWYKTLELIGSTDYHFIDVRDETDLLYLISKMGITEQELINIYDLLAKLGAIDKDLWNEKIIFSENFVNNVEDVYERRKGINVLHKLDLCNHLGLNANGKEQSKLKETKVKKSIYIYTNFYDSEILKAKDSHYENFVKFLFGENEIKKKLSGLLSIRDQLTYEQFKKILKVAKDFDKNIKNEILNFENGGYYKKKMSLYLTLNKWLKSDFGKKEKFNNPEISEQKINPI